MQIIVVYFLYHVCLKKAIVQVVLKIKSVDCTNVLVFHYFLSNLAHFFISEVAQLFIDKGKYKKKALLLIL